MFRPEAAGFLKVFALNIQHYNGVGPVQQIGNHNTDPLAAARGRRQQNELLPREHQKLSLVFANDQTVVGQQPRLADFTAARKARITVQRPFLAGQVRDDQPGRHEHQRQGSDAGTHQFFPVRRHARQLIPQVNVIAR